MICKGIRISLQLDWFHYAIKSKENWEKKQCKKHYLNGMVERMEQRRKVNAWEGRIYVWRNIFLQICWKIRIFLFSKKEVTEWWTWVVCGAEFWRDPRGTYNPLSSAPCADRVAIKLLKAERGKWSQRLCRVILLISDIWKSFRAMEGGFHKLNVKASAVPVLNSIKLSQEALLYFL